MPFPVLHQHLRTTAFHTAIVALLTSCCALAHAETRQLPGTVTLNGTFKQGGMILGKCPPPCTAIINGKSLRMTRQGDFVFGFGRDAPLQQSLTVNVGGHKGKPYVFSIGKRKYSIQSVTGVPQATVEPPPEVMDRIAREQALVNAARNVNSERTDFLSGFSWPLKGRISGIYGSQRIYNGKPGNPHYGLDIAAPVGTPVKAPMAGVVRLAEPDLYFSGGTLILDHGHGIFTSYIHLSKVLAKVGQEIKRGEVIAKVGATGRASGPHLDWRINWFEDRLDPMYTLPHD